MATSDKRSPQRKKATRQRREGKAGMREVEAALEEAGLVEQQVARENDIGRDAFVDLVADGEVTGGVVAVQVKSGPSYISSAGWLMALHS